MDKYLDTFFEKNASWWASDDDTDNLTNEEEFKWGTHPGSNDTDGDGLHDVVETTDSYSNPLLKDTDGDGLEDLEKSVEGTAFQDYGIPTGTA